MFSLFDELSIDNPFKIGIIGGGQLGKMIAQEAKRMFLSVNILDPNENCPASTICDKLIIADFKDEEKIYELAKQSDLIKASITYSIIFLPFIFSNSFSVL